MYIKAGLGVKMVAKSSGFNVVCCSRCEKTPRSGAAEISRSNERGNTNLPGK